MGVGVVIPLAALGLMIRPAEAVVLRIGVFVNVVPTVAIAPILVVALDNETGRIVITALQVYFPALVGILFGLRQADERALDLIRASGGGSWAALRYARLAAAVPSFISALQIAVPAAILGALIAEFFGAHEGLGSLLVNAQQGLLVDRTWAIAAVVGLVAAAGYGLVTVAAKLFVPWAASEASVGVSVAGADAKKHSRLASATASAATIGILLGGWQSLRTVFDFDPFFTKGPMDVLTYITQGHPIHGTSAGTFWAEFSEALGQTAVDAGVGFVVGSLVAVAAAVILDAFPTLARVFMPMAVVLRSVPLAALTPLIVLLFGRGMLGVTIVVTLVTFFPTLVTVMQGLRSTPKGPPIWCVPPVARPGKQSAMYDSCMRCRQCWPPHVWPFRAPLLGQPWPNGSQLARGWAISSRWPRRRRTTTCSGPEVSCSRCSRSWCTAS
ncbi:ABC transporter permease subunit [Nesterenkonia pannonica]|uniref:ABC transporter permease n=1 Tax=Nesterenkonia pannonica TaxID=1548602 RepID=UPI00216484FC|nr:ABC transporter permease subunit [Nesterenkonia pannonica]